jgi:Protein kinase domain
MFVYISYLSLVSLNSITHLITHTFSFFPLSDVVLILSFSLSVSLSLSSSFNQTIEDIEELVDMGFMIGQGRGGSVRKVLHQPTDQYLALKVIAMDVTEDMRKQIILELRTLHESSHPSIVSFFGGFYQEGSVYLALEYMDCGSLLDLVKVCTEASVCVG